LAEGGGLSLPWGLLRMQRFVPGGSVYFGLHVPKNNTTDLTKKIIFQSLHTIAQKTMGD